jgi:hypothetical protein
VTVKVDTGDLGWRRRDLDREFFSFIKGIGMQIGLVDPTAHQKLAFNNALAPDETNKQNQLGALYHVVTTSRSVSPVWRPHTTASLVGERPNLVERNTKSRGCDDGGEVWDGRDRH